MPSQLSSPPIIEDLVEIVHHQTGYVRLLVVDQGKNGVVLRNGLVSRLLRPGLRLMIRLPFQKLETRIVEMRVRTLPIMSQGEFITVDQWRVNISLLASYQVIQSARVVVEHAQPVKALHGMIKDLLGQQINRENFFRLNQQGRPLLRQQLLQGSAQLEESLGIALVDVRVDDLTLPEQVGSAFDQRRVAEMQGEAAQWRLRGKWQDMPEDIKRQHLVEQVAGGAIFVNPPIGGMDMGFGSPNASAAHRPPTPRALESTHNVRGEIWGQLTVISSQHQGRMFNLQSPRLTIGRAQNNDIALPDPSISSRHAQIDQSMAITDLNSRNGTFVNGHHIRTAQLRGGETIRLGDTHLRFDLR
jgi:hypothetical protein